MIPSLQRKHGLRLLLLVVFISLTNTVLAQWVKVDTSGIMTSIAGDGKYIYVGVRASGIIRSSDNGTTWVNVNNGLGSANTIDVKSFCVAKNNILAGTGTGIFISSDHGDHWTKTNFDPVHGPVYGLLDVDSLIFAGSDTGDEIHQIGSQQGGIFLSTDKGQSWVRSDSGLGSNSNYYGVHDFAKIGSTLFAGTQMEGIFSSNNNGKSWTTNHLGGGKSESMVVIDSTLFVGYHEDYPFRSSDLGTSWTLCDSGLKVSAPYLASSGKFLIVGTTFNGIYFSPDMGDHWKPFNNGLDSLSYNIFSVAITGNYVFAGGGRYLWRRPLSEITLVEKITPALSKGFELNQNYPNPFNPSTTINYSIPLRSFVTITIFDVLGRKVTSLVNREMAAGNHKVSFNGSSFSSGIYFYQLKADDYITYKKMVLVR